MTCLIIGGSCKFFLPIPWQLLSFSGRILAAASEARAAGIVTSTCCPCCTVHVENKLLIYISCWKKWFGQGRTYPVQACIFAILIICIHRCRFTHDRIHPSSWMVTSCYFPTVVALNGCFHMIPWLFPWRALTSQLLHSFSSLISSWRGRGLLVELHLFHHRPSFYW